MHNYMYACSRKKNVTAAKTVKRGRNTNAVYVDSISTWLVWPFGIQTKMAYLQWDKNDTLKQHISAVVVAMATKIPIGSFRSSGIPTTKQFGLRLDMQRLINESMCHRLDDLNSGTYLMSSSRQHQQKEKENHHQVQVLNRAQTILFIINIYIYNGYVFYGDL